MLRNALLFATVRAACPEFGFVAANLDPEHVERSKLCFARAHRF
ncbi:hypothetical protein [Rhodopseudomonas sp. P2A-2r]|nr:hypothetical protein [Rhodopseudomonas sp. P2A-2r]UZE48425.1 hypothetical protein ONR75_27090 [Rhodopseudomonas sp. P2A-2r]